MHIDILPGTSNVVRFPIERRARATMTRVRELAPDVRELDMIAEVFGFESPAIGYRDDVDAETARYIAEQAPAPGAARDALLHELEKTATEAAMGAILAARDAAASAQAAREFLERATREGGYMLDPLRDLSERRNGEWATLTLKAYARFQEAEGVARAVELARRGERWKPRDVHAEMDELLAFEAARRAR